MLWRSLAPSSIPGHYLHCADSYRMRSICQHGTTTGCRGRGTRPAARQFPGLDLRAVGRDPARLERIGHRCARAADRHRRRDRRQAVRGHGHDHGRGHPRHRSARAGRLRPPDDRPGRSPPGRRRGRARTGGDGPVAARVTRARQCRGGRALLPRAAGADQRLPVADGRPHPDRGRAPADVTRGRPLRADRTGRACRPARRSDIGPPHVPIGRPGPQAPAGPIGDRPLPRAVRGRDPAGPGARRSRARPVPRRAVRLAQADRRRSRSTQRSRGRSISSAGSTGSRPTCAT